MMATRKMGVFFPEIVDIPDELHKALQAFKLSQERYEDAERTFTAALERNERPSRMQLERLESEYFHNAIIAANMAAARVRDIAPRKNAGTGLYTRSEAHSQEAADGS